MAVTQLLCLLCADAPVPPFAACGENMAAPKKSECGPRRGFMEMIKAAFALATDRTDFRRNLIVNLGLFAAGVYIARNLSDIDLMAPQPVQ